ncbi:hypothetical protein BTZ20_5395 [Rhodococcus sp. MTM3W5.2]|nr:hypothetical protein BTZ20_5395 [Rhodococcus sp. MTM3W5.2]
MQGVGHRRVLPLWAGPTSTNQLVGAQGFRDPGNVADRIRA